MKKRFLVLCIFAFLALAPGASARSGDNPVYLPLIQGPVAAPLLSAPQNQHFGFYQFSWSPIANATAYTLEEDKGAGFAPVYTGPLTTWTSFDMAPTGAVPIVYRVNATVNGAPTDWSNTQSVTVNYGFTGSGVVLNYSTFKDPTPGSGIRYVVGEIYTGDAPAGPIQVWVTFTQGSTPAGTYASFAYATYSGAHSLVPFKILADDPAGFTDYTVTVNVQPSSQTAPKLTILSQNQSVNASGQLVISGQIRNDSAGNAASKNTQVVGTLYDANGLIINTDYVDVIPSTVEFGQTRDYTMTFTYPLASSIASWRIQAFGEP